MLYCTWLFKMPEYSFWPKGSPFADFLLREIPERIVLFLLFICLFQKPLIANIWSSYTKVHDSKVERVGYTSCYELIITLVCHCYCHYKAEGNYTVRILSKSKYKLIPGRFRESMGLEKLEILNSTFQVTVEVYRSYHRNLVRSNWQKSTTLFLVVYHFSLASIKQQTPRSLPHWVQLHSLLSLLITIKERAKGKHPEKYMYLRMYWIYWIPVICLASRQGLSNVWNATGIRSWRCCF